MMDPIRRTILATGVAATAVVTAGTRLFAQKTGQGGAAMGTYEKGSVRIHFEQAGSGFPLLVIPGGGHFLQWERADIVNPLWIQTFGDLR